MSNDSGQQSNEYVIRQHAPAVVQSAMQFIHYIDNKRADDVIILNESEGGQFEGSSQQRVHIEKAVPLDPMENQTRLAALELLGTYFRGGETQLKGEQAMMSHAGRQAIMMEKGGGGAGDGGQHAPTPMPDGFQGPGSSAPTPEIHRPT